MLVGIGGKTQKLTRLSREVPREVLIRLLDEPNECTSKPSTQFTKTDDPTSTPPKPSTNRGLHQSSRSWALLLSSSSRAYGSSLRIIHDSPNKGCD